MKAGNIFGGPALFQLPFEVPGGMRIEQICQASHILASFEKKMRGLPIRKEMGICVKWQS